MGFPPRLNGKSSLLDSDNMETCPNCHRKFSVYDIADKDNRKVVRVCPYCDYEFEVKFNDTGKKGKLP
jgi:transcription elongation factor Elf1